jgi:hypothetical protein
MIVNIRGTSGSGKSWLVNAIKEEMTEVIKLFEDGRKKPIAYLGMFGENKVMILGHYEIPTGGCDTISKQDHIFGLAEQGANEGFHVLFEGRLPSIDVKRTVPLSRKHDTLVLHIDLSIEECLEWVNIRRRRKNPEAEDVNPKNTTNIHRQIHRTMARLKSLGVNIRRGTREEVLEWTREALSA